MKYVLIWAILGANGIGSGSAEFDDQEACRAAGVQLGAFVQLMQNRNPMEKAHPGTPKSDFTCAAKATSK